MFNSFKDRLNSAVSSGIVPKIEEARKKLSGDEGERNLSGTSPGDSPTKAEPSSEVDGLEDESKGAGSINKSLLTTSPNVTSDQRTSLESARGDAGEENGGEVSNEIKQKLEKLKKYEIKYPELAKAYKFQQAKLKSLDQVLQTWTPVQSHSDHDDLENYLKNMVSQTAMTTSEFKAISQLKNDLEAKAEELQKSLDSATAQINELQNEKDSLKEKEKNIALPELLQQFKARIAATDLSGQSDETRNSLSELATSVFQGLGHNELEEKARDAAQALKEARAQLDSLSQEHRKTLKDLEDLREKATQADDLVHEKTILEGKYSELCQLFPSGDDPISSLKTHLKDLSDAKCELEKKVSIQSGIVTSLKQTVDAKTEQIETLTKDIEKLTTTSPGTALTSPSSSGPPKPTGGKKKKKKGASGQSPKSPTAAVEQQASAQNEVDMVEYNRLCKLADDQKNELTDVSNKLTLATKELEETKATLSSVQAQLDSQTTEHSRTSSELTELTSCQKALESTHNNLKEELALQISEYKRASAEMSDLYSRHAALELSHSELQKEIDSQKKKEAELEEQLKANANKEEETSKKLEAAAQLETQLKAVNTKLEEVQDESKKHQETIARLNKRIGQLEKDIKAKEAALTYSKRQCSQLEQEKKDIETELTALQKQVKNLNATSKKKEEELAACLAELKPLKIESKACKAKLADAESKNVQYEGQVKELQDSYDAEKTSAKALAEENICLKQQAESAVKDKDEAQQKLESQVQTLADLQQELGDLKKRCEILDQELITSRGLFKEKAASLDALHLQHVQLQQSAEEEASKLNSELQAYKDKQQFAQTQLEAHQASTQNEIKTLQDKLAETQKKLEEHGALVQELSAHKEEHTAKFSSLNATIEGLTAANQKYESELAQAQEKQVNRVQ
ncbi:Golgin imh1, variant 2 [Entomophthora muscae]|uniref:Golgin imh1, variant 2 n=1 Tax=Entomophthora muscae TaxID=34485 RepID=A0ACC2S9N1_9FUNG|nr:Golgin imh1, variant 2 [Entomophthora muscae]